MRIAFLATLALLTSGCRTEGAETPANPSADAGPADAGQADAGGDATRDAGLLYPFWQRPEWLPVADAVGSCELASDLQPCEVAPALRDAGLPDGAAGDADAGSDASTDTDASIGTDAGAGEVVGGAWCIAQSCQPIRCGSSACAPTGPSFEWRWRGERAFERSGDVEPVVRDRQTKLMWQGCAGGLRGRDCEVGAPLEAWGSAGRTCEDLVWGGHDDWSLPDIFQLVSLSTEEEISVPVDAGAPVPLTLARGLPRDMFPRLPEGSLWSSSLATSVIAMQPQSGMLESVFGYAFVLCVRREEAGRAIDEYRFASAYGDEQEVVYDRATGLMWSTERANHSDWQQAAQYCADLRWGGVDDWHLPSLRQAFSVYVPGSLDFADAIDVFGHLSTSTLSSESDLNGLGALILSSFGDTSWNGGIEAATRCVRETER